LCRRQWSMRWRLPNSREVSKRQVHGPAAIGKQWPERFALTSPGRREGERVFRLTIEIIATNYLSTCYSLEQHIPLSALPRSTLTRSTRRREGVRKVSGRCRKAPEGARRCRKVTTVAFRFVPLRHPPLPRGKGERAHSESVTHGALRSVCHGIRLPFLHVRAGFIHTRKCVFAEDSDE